MTDSLNPSDIAGQYGAYTQMADAASTMAESRARLGLDQPQVEQGKPVNDGIEVKPMPDYPGVYGVYVKGALAGFSQDQASAEAIAAQYRGKTGKDVGSGGTGPAESVTAGLGKSEKSTPMPPGLAVHPATEATGDFIARVGKDIGSGLVQLPTMVGTGILKGSAEMFRAGDSLANWLEENIGTLGLGDLGPDAARHPGQAIADWLEQKASGGLPEPRSVTAQITQGIAQFAVGAKVAGDVLGVAGTTGTTAKAAKDVAATAVAGGVAFDPYEGNLANLIQKFPALKNPVTEALAVDPNDSKGVARVKNGLVTALTVLGVKGAQKLAEGLWRGIQVVRAARRAGSEPAKAMSQFDQQRAQFGSVSEGQLSLGDAKEPAVKVVDTATNVATPVPTGTPVKKIGQAVTATETGVPSDVAAKGLVKSGEAGGKEVYVNFARINTPEDVKKVIGQMADAFSSDIDKARRGVRSNETTKAAADALGLDVKDVLARRSGQLFNAEEALAARQLWAASAEKLTELAKKAADPNAGAVDLYNFRRMMAIHYALQAEVVGARTETARALQSWAIPAGGNVERARAVQMLLDQAGGADLSKGMAQRLAILAESGAPADAVAAFTRKGWAATSWDIVQESFVNGLLWNPKTHLANMSSNTVAALQQIYERKIAEHISKALGPRSGAQSVVEGEWIAQTYGMLESLRDMMRVVSKGGKVARAFMTGGDVSGAQGELQAARTAAMKGTNLLASNKMEVAHTPALSGQRLAVEAGADPAAAQAFRQTGMGKAVDFLGFATRIPGKALGGEDALFKSIGYRMEVYAQALRQATAEGLSGPALYERMAQLANNPTEAIRIAAVDQMLYQTFTNAPGKWATALMNARREIPPTVIALPFVRTPANLFRYSFERSPLAPFVAQWRADVAAGGARAETALARAATGSAILAVFADSAYNGYITGAGPSEPAKAEALRRQGWQPYSVSVGNKWYQYNRVLPIGMMLSAVATMGELVKSSELAPEDYDELTEIMGAAGYAITQSIVDQSFMQGAADLAAVAKDPKQFLPSYLNSLLGSMVPLGSAQALVNEAIDPTARETMGPWSAVQQRLAFLKERLTPKRDLWGEEVKPQAVYGRTFDLVSPVRASEYKESPIDAEIGRLGISIARIAKKTSFAGVDINFRDFPKAYDEYVRLAGNDLKDPGHNNLGAKDFLDSVVSGKSQFSELYRKLYSDGPEGMKAQFIKQTIHQYRQMAAQKILADPRFSDLRLLYDQKRQEAQQAKTPPGMTIPALQ